MPLTEDPQLVQLSKDVIAQFQTLFGAHPGKRPAHARGLLLSGSFIPSPSASSISSAPHLSPPALASPSQSSADAHSHPIPIIARFSSSTGCPALSDTDPNANPRGLAIRFNLGTDESGRRVHTDVISHTARGFPTRTGEEFLGLLRSLEKGTVGDFLGGNPSAQAWVGLPKPSPSSFAAATYFSGSAYKFTNAEGESVFGRYLVESIAPEPPLTTEELAESGENFLFDELKDRVRSDKRARHGGAGGAGGGGVEFILRVEIADPAAGDVVDDASVPNQWPTSGRKIVDLGRVVLDDIVGEEDDLEGAGVAEEQGVNAKNAEVQRNIIFDPIPRVKGIEASDDPLFELRAALYLMSGRQRREAGKSEGSKVALEGKAKLPEAPQEHDVEAKERLGRSGVEA